ncbi:uncharacterized protein DNG_07403 [Cephalotrichum gorgonifer]|uniref:Rhodopsin domain-containing protein n=1 Tax=Cephalotrichum gorgonifer TaxID=2041049 RepID=A0AAE8N462_9PEZI|nr:uncharacterized protein DNG_07403 [Cephalotrichum gorgonifer]
MESRGGTLYAVMSAFAPAATIAVGLRIYSRVKYSYIGADDILVILAMVLFYGFVATTVTGTQLIGRVSSLLVETDISTAVHYGMGSHISDVPPERVVVMAKCGFTSQIIYPPSMGLVKISILLFLCRILPAVHSWKVPLKCFAVLIAVAETAFTFALIFQCSPVHQYWDRAKPGPKCVNRAVLYFIDASVNIFCDLAILVIPTLLFRRDVVNLVIFSCAELSSALIFSSVPTFKPLYAGLRDKYRSQGASTGSRSSGSGHDKVPGQNPIVQEYSSESLRSPRQARQHL